MINGVVGSNSKSTVCTNLNETRIVWVCGIDPANSARLSVGKRLQVTCPANVNNMLVNGSCAALP
jgi:hypothetical protein